MNYQKFLKEKSNKDSNKYLTNEETIEKYHSQSKLQEESENYNLESTYINNEHDKIFRKILDDKNEAAKFISKALNLRVKLTEKEIEKYNSSFVTNNLKNQESDIIYKMKSKNIFFLIEHQTKIDYTMPLRILEYENEIMKSAIDKERLGKKGYKFPKVISIVLYSGRKKWKVKDYISKVQEKLEGYEDAEFARYNIVDVNDYNEEELLREENFLSKALLIEKTRYTNNIVYYLEKIVEELNYKKEIYTKEQKELLINIIELVLNKKLNEKEKEKTKKIIEKLRGGNKTMLAVLEMIEEENKRILKKGRIAGEKSGIKKGKIEVAKKMIEKQMTIEAIVEMTGLSEEEIKKIAKRLTQ